MLRIAVASRVLKSHYTDQVHDGTGLMYHRARQYDPVLAHFVQPDTIIPTPPTATDTPTYATTLSITTDPSGREECGWRGGVCVRWNEVENFPGVRDPNTGVQLHGVHDRGAGVWDRVFP